MHILSPVRQAIDTPLAHGEFAEAMKGHQGIMSVVTLVNKALTGIESGKLEIRPGLSQVLYLMSRVAPAFMLGQFAQMMRREG